MAAYNGIEYQVGTLANYVQGYSPKPGTAYGNIKFNYFKMMAYDTSANTWRTWIAAGAPDLTAVQYNGSAFPFTQVFVAARL